MNIDFAENYDREEDIYYVTFKTGEPSYVIELDDVLLLEVGIFTNMPTGFRVLHFTKNKVGSVQILVKKIRRAIEEATKQYPETLRSRESQIEQTLEKILA
jgi:hypothetical protein